MTASLKRAATLEPSKVGLSQLTINKHVTWVAQLFKHAISFMGLAAYESFDFGKVRKKPKKTRKNQKRLSWTDYELAELFNAPVWHGCAALFDRLTPGEHVWHDAWYFGPIGLAMLGTRCEEFIGLSLDEIYDEAPIPYLPCARLNFVT